MSRWLALGVLRMDNATLPDLAPRMAGVATRLLGNPTTRSKIELRYGRKGSLAIDLRRGCWFNHETGEGGGVLSLIQREIGLSGREALAWLGMADDTPMPCPAPRQAAPRADDDRQQRNRERAARIWQEAVPLPDTLGAVYLDTRVSGGAAIAAASGAVRFHCACPWGAERRPAVVSLMTCPTTNEPTGVHRTALNLDGTKHDRMMLGGAGIVRLIRDEDVTQGVGIAEGLETALAVMASGWRPVWACLTAGGIARFPVRLGICSLTIFADHDAAGLAAARTCAERYAAAGREARIVAPPTPGADWNDWLREADHV